MLHECSFVYKEHYVNKMSQNIFYFCVIGQEDIHDIIRISVSNANNHTSFLNQRTEAQHSY